MLEMKRYDNNKWREVVFLENDTEYDTKHYNWKYEKGLNDKSSVLFHLEYIEIFKNHMNHLSKLESNILLITKP